VCQGRSCRHWHAAPARSVSGAGAHRIDRGAVRPSYEARELQVVVVVAEEGAVAEPRAEVAGQILCGARLATGGGVHVGLAQIDR
jgi:hypothetical protein